MSKVYELVTSMHNAAGNFFQNVFKFELSESGTGVNPWDYAVALINSWVTHNRGKYLKLFGNDVFLDFITAKKLSAPGGPSAAVADGGAGTGAGNSVSSGASADVQWQSDSPLNRPGHTYLAAFPADSLLQDAFQAPYTGDITSFINQQLLPLALAGALGTATFCLYSRATDTQHTINAGLLRPKATMMNRRLLPQI